MPDEFVIRLNDTESEIRSTLTDSAGAAIDLSTATSVFFVMRSLAGVSKVNAAATILSAPAGTVLYQWLAPDTDTAGLYLAEWKVTWTGGGIQTFPNDQPILVRVSNASLTPSDTNYITLEDLKQTLGLQAQGYADGDLMLAISAASRAVDDKTGRVFAPHVGADTTRVFANSSRSILTLPDFYGTPVVSWNGGTKTVDTDYILQPSDGPPWDSLRAYRTCLPIDLRAVSITAKWGYPAIPAAVQEATKIIAARLFRRPREAAFGVAGFGLEGEVFRITWTDPDVEALLNPYRRTMIG